MELLFSFKFEPQVPLLQKYSLNQSVANCIVNSSPGWTGCTYIYTQFCWISPDTKGNIVNSGGATEFIFSESTYEMWWFVWKFYGRFTVTIMIPSLSLELLTTDRFIVFGRRLCFTYTSCLLYRDVTGVFGIIPLLN